jgi:hypothetical protein
MIGISRQTDYAARLVLHLAALDVSANQVVHPNSGKLKAPTNSFPGDSGEHP